MFNSKNTALREAQAKIGRQQKDIERLRQEKKELLKKIEYLQNNVDDSYRSYPKIEFLTKTYSSILADIKKQMDMVILSAKYASEKVVRGDIGMMDADAILARAFSRVVKMSPQEIDDEIQEGILEDTETGTLTFRDADEFNSSRDYGFRNNKVIRDIVLPEGVKVIKRGFFYGCTNLRKLRLPASVTKIEDYAFFGCASLKRVVFEENSRLTGIGDYAFSSCVSLKELELPERVRSISSAAFRECSSLRSVTYRGEEIEKIGNHVFQNCGALQEFQIPEAVSLLQTSLFSGCTGMERIVVPAGVELVMDYVFRDCAGLKELVFESADTAIARYTLLGVPAGAVITVEGEELKTRAVPDRGAVLCDLMGSEES